MMWFPTTPFPPCYGRLRGNLVPTPVEVKKRRRFPEQNQPLVANLRQYAVTKSTSGSDLATGRMTLELGAWALAFIALVCLVSGFAHGAIGFGFPLVATPLVALVIDIKLAIGLLAPVTLVLVVITALQGGGLPAVAKRFWYLPVTVGIGSWLGTRLLLAAPPEPFLLVLALVMILYLNLERVGRGANPAVQRWAFGYGLAFGFAAGIFEAVANVAGPVLLLYFMLLGLSPLD